MKTRRLTALLAGFLAVCAPARPASSQRLIVLNKSEQSAWLIDAASGRMMRKFDVGRGPHEIIVSPDRLAAYVANFGRFGVFPPGDTTHTQPGNTLTVFNLTTTRVRTTFDLGTHTGPHGVAISRDGHRLWVTSETPNALLELDPESGNVLHVWPTGQQRTHLVEPSPDEKTFYVTNTVSGSLSVIDRATGAVKNIPIGPGAEGLTVSPDGREVWVATRNDSKIYVVSTATNAVVATFAAGGDGPQRVRFTPDGKQVWAANVRSNTLSVFDARTRDLLGIVSVGAGPGGLVFSRDGTQCFVALAGANQIAVISVGKRTVTRTFATGVEPDGIAWISGM